MKAVFKIIELEDYDVLIQKHWSQNKKETKKHGKYQLIMSFWLDKISCKVIMGYDNESLMIQDYDNSSKEKVGNLMTNWLKFHEDNK